MAHCAHILAPSCAWAESTEPKQRSRSIASRLGNAIRAMKPGKRPMEEKVFKEMVIQEQVCVINTDASMTKSSSRKSMSDDETSTMSGESRRSSGTTLSTVWSSESLQSLEEVSSLPGSVEDSSTSSSPPRLREEISMPSSTPRMSELHELATHIANRANSKFSGRVYLDVRNAFIAVDANGDGKLTPTEALAFCQHFDLSPSITSRFFTLLDQNETGLADWSSFLARYAPVFQKKATYQLNGAGRKWPAIQ